MSEHRKIWAVSEGDYSAYHVIAVVDGTEEDAIRLAGRLSHEGSYNNPYVEEFFLVREPDVQVVSELTLWATLNSNGEVIGSWEREELLHDIETSLEVPPVQWCWSSNNRGGGSLKVFGSDHERVRKVFSDRLAQFVAEALLRAHGSEGDE